MITFMEAFAHELEMERVGTQKILALVPADKADYKPHHKSMALRDLVSHIADIPSWITHAITTDGLDFAKNPYSPEPFTDATSLVAYFNRNADTALATLMSNKDEILLENWTLRNGEDIYLSLTKMETIRHSFGQLIHHRAQLGVYLRLLDIPIPGMYGPSADGI